MSSSILWIGASPGMVSILAVKVPDCQAARHRAQNHGKTCDPLLGEKAAQSLFIGLPRLKWLPKGDSIFPSDRDNRPTPSSVVQSAITKRSDIVGTWLRG